MRKKSAGKNTGRKVRENTGKSKGKVTSLPVTSLPVMGNGQIIHKCGFVCADILLPCAPEW
jgi:hypothetical protein